MRTLTVLLISMILASASDAAAITDPHQKDGGRDTCLLCHEKTFDATDAPRGGGGLVENNIDAVCLRCHVKTECCVIGQKHMGGLFIGYSHPSGVEERDIKEESLPRTLPLQDGKMTCNTCHLHLRGDGRDYKLVRLVDFRDTGVDWTRLCRDCHKNF